MPVISHRPIGFNSYKTLFYNKCDSSVLQTTFFRVISSNRFRCRLTNFFNTTFVNTL